MSRSSSRHVDTSDDEGGEEAKRGGDPRGDRAPIGPNGKSKPRERGRRTSITISVDPDSLKEKWDSTSPAPDRKGKKKKMDGQGSPGLAPIGSSIKDPKGKRETLKTLPDEDLIQNGAGYKWKPGKDAMLKMRSMQGQYDDDGPEGEEDGQQLLGEDKGADTIVELNCGGIRFESRIKTLRKHPGTMLSNLADVDGQLYEEGYSFFDRDPMAFNYVLNFYRYDRLVMPSFMSEEQW